MVPKNLCIALVCVTLLASGSGAAADQYRPGEFLSLDLSTAVLSPKPLGPAASFTPVPVEARADRQGQAAQARLEPKAEPGTVRPRTRVVRAEKPRGAAKTKLERRHGNPLDAQAFDTRVQVWPCKSGGICNWSRPSRANQGGDD